MSPPSMPARVVEPEPTTPAPRVTSEDARMLSLVRDVSQLLADHDDLDAALKQALQVLVGDRSRGAVVGTVLVPGDGARQSDICVTDGTTSPRPRSLAGSAAAAVLAQVLERATPMAVA